jgi:hypothetical protein
MDKYVHLLPDDMGEAPECFDVVAVSDSEGEYGGMDAMAASAPADLRGSARRPFSSDATALRVCPEPPPYLLPM